jgi:transposase
MESFPEVTSKVTALARGTGIEDRGWVSGARTRRPDPEVPERARRRRFTAKYKTEILAAYDAAAHGEKGALLRREGLYSSQPRGVAASPRRRRAGRAPGASRPQAARPAAGEDRRPGGGETAAGAGAGQGPLGVDVQAKLHGLLERLSESADTEPRSTP